MNLLIFPVSQATAPFSDTVTVVAADSFLATAQAVSTIVLTLAVMGVLVAVIGVLAQLRKLTRSVGSVAKRLEKEAAPVMERARSVASNVDYITAAVRSDVQKVNESVAHLNERLKDASERMEERIQDFTALVEVIQDEAEDLALDTAAAVRGVRAGTRALASERTETKIEEKSASGFISGGSGFISEGEEPEG